MPLYRYDKLDKVHVSKCERIQVGLVSAPIFTPIKMWEVKQINWRRVQRSMLEDALISLNDPVSVELKQEDLVSDDIQLVRSSVINLADCFVELFIPYTGVHTSVLGNMVAPFGVIFDAVQNAATAVEAGSSRLSNVLAKLVMTWADVTSRELDSDHVAGNAMLKVCLLF